MDHPDLPPNLAPTTQRSADDTDKTEDTPTREQEGAPPIERFYDQDSDEEWRRLDRHRMEFAISMRVLTEYLPPAPQTILDDGGGPGRYALALAALGHQVTLLDLSQGNLALARRRAQESDLAIQRYVHGNALDLGPLHPQTFNAVLLLGPLYHLLTEPERRQAVDEAWRLLRPGGLIFAAFITRFAPFRDLAARTPTTLVERRAEWEAILRSGVYRAGQGVGFTDAYFAHPAEIQPFMEQANFETLDLVGCEGIVARNEEQVNQLSGDAWQTWVEFNYRMGKEPSLYGAADHLLYVGRRPAN